MQRDSKRESGFYWVRFEGQVIVAEYTADGAGWSAGDGQWWRVPGSSESFEDEQVCELLSERILTPGEDALRRAGFPSKLRWAEKPPRANEMMPPTDQRKPIWHLVVDDMFGRDALGRNRYGTPLVPFNGRDALRDAYEEALDLAVYLRQAIYERDNPELLRANDNTVATNAESREEPQIQDTKLEL